MKIFYSELAAQPAYFSFGYSIYGELEEDDQLDEVYAKGFLPCVVAKQQSPNQFYMARGVRVCLPEFNERHYHARVRRKAEEKFPQGIQTIVYARDEHPEKDVVLNFFLTYFAFKFGKESMSRERLEAIFSSPFLTHIVEYREGAAGKEGAEKDGKIVGYTLETHTDSLVHVWHQAYAREYLNTHVGIYLYLELIKRAKETGAQFLYFGVTYGRWMTYKTNFQPLEYWSGAEWVRDKNSAQLKGLFAGDDTRMVAFVDEWRKVREPYYATQYPFSGRFGGLRYLVTLASIFPRYAGVYLLLVGALLGLIMIGLYIH